MGYPRAGGRGYLSGGFGHPAITDPGDGTVLIDQNTVWASGKKIKTGGGSSVGAPFLTVDGAETHGVHLAAGNVTISVNGADKLVVAGTVIQVKDLFDITNEFRSVAGTAQQIDLASDTIVHTIAAIELLNDTGGDILLTSTPTLAAGVDGEIVFVVSVGADNVGIQDDGALAGSDVYLKNGDVVRTLEPGRGIYLKYNTAVPGWSEM